MNRLLLCLCLICLMAGSVTAQTWDVGSDSAQTESRRPTAFTPAVEWRDWTPMDEQFRLYINYEPNTGDGMPHIDILGKIGSYPFTMQFVSDTLHLIIAPPGATITDRATVDHLPAEVPIKVWAGTEQAVYWLSIGSHTYELEVMEPAKFLTVEPVRPIPDSTAPVQLTISGPRSYGLVKELLSQLGDQVSVVQMDDGFYQNIWQYVRKVTVNRYKVNETATGTLVFLRVHDPAALETLKQLSLASR